jgi:hypothetical protein
MMIRTKHEAEKLAARYLSDLSVGRRKIDVDVSADRHEGNYWYILVTPKQSMPDWLRFFEVLAKIETKIHKETGEDVLFVPAAV